MISNRILTNERVVFVGDIHGNIEVLMEAVDFADKIDAKIVFIGDYVDSYPNSRADQEKCLRYVKEHHEDDDKYFLRGNHENNYLDHANWACSGYSSNFHREIAPVMNSIEFLDYVVVNNNILVTHAGLSKVFIEEEWINPFNNLSDGEMMEYLTTAIEKAVEDPSNKIYSAGRESGGYHPSGGIFWCRPQNFRSFGDEIVQIFGHTRGANIRNFASQKAFCIDCLEDPTQPYQLLVYNPENSRRKTDNFHIISL